MTTKPWPKGNRMLALDELLAPLQRILREAYDTSRVRPHKFSPYDGFATGEAAITLSPDQMFQPEQVAYEADQGRSVADIALIVAFRLGVEQGRRLERTRKEPVIEALRVMETLVPTPKSRVVKIMIDMVAGKKLSKRDSLILAAGASETSKKKRRT
jgi:hypothetical protein